MEVIMPQLGETVAEGMVAVWHKSVGDEVKADELLLDIETDKATMEVTAPSAGRLAEIRVEAGQTVEVGTLLAVIEGEDVSPSVAGTGTDAVETSSETIPAPMHADTGDGDGHGTEPEATGNQPLSPAVRRICTEHNLDPADIPGSGRKGRITKRDVLQFLDGRTEEVTNRPAPTEPTQDEPGDTATHPFNRIRKSTAEHMVRSKATSPHVLQAVEVDFSAVDRLRSAQGSSWKESYGYSLTYLPFVARAVCRALKQYPHLNASVRGDGLVLHQEVNLAIAVDLGSEGLVAPVIRSAQDLTVAGLARQIHDLSAKARGGKLKQNHLSGGTYTLSNSGTFGTLITAPIINQPQVAILSIDGVRKRPVVLASRDGDTLAIRPVGILAQSFDHRAVDGAYSAAFLDTVKTLLETRDWSGEL